MPYPYRRIGVMSRSVRPYRQSGGRSSVFPEHLTHSHRNLIATA